MAVFFRIRALSRDNEEVAGIFVGRDEVTIADIAREVTRKHVAVIGIDILTEDEALSYAHVMELTI